jgi:hypothetical protein
MNSHISDKHLLIIEYNDEYEMIKKVNAKNVFTFDISIYEKLKKFVNDENKVYQWRRQYVRENKSGVCPTLTANMGMGGHNVPIIKDKKGIRNPFLPTNLFWSTRSPNRSRCRKSWQSPNPSTRVWCNNRKHCH